MIQPNSFLSRLPVYEPGKPIEDVARDFGLDPAKIIKLASNENPLGPSPKAVEILKETASKVHFYPDGNGFRLRKAIAAKLGVEIDNVVLGNGSNEIIEFLGHAYLSTGDEMVVSQYAFAIYEIVGRMFQAEVKVVPAVHYGHDLKGMRNAVSKKTRIVFVANPNNPTGTCISASELRSWIESVPEDVLVVIDEAYQEFLLDPLNTPALISKYPNLVVMRTFSKAQGLAGLRIGYGVASKGVADSLQKVRQPFQANLPAQEAALAALSDDEHIQKTVQLIREGMRWLESELKKRNLIFIPSSGNFLMVKTGDGKKCFMDLMKQGIIVRPMQGYGLPEWVRVTVGTSEQNERFIGALDLVVKN